MLDRDFAQHIEDLYAQGDKADALAARGAFVRLRDALGAGHVRAAEPDPSSPTGWRCNPWVKQGILLGFRFGRLVDQSMDHGRLAVLRQGHDAAQDAGAGPSRPARARRLGDPRRRVHRQRRDLHAADVREHRRLRERVHADRLARRSSARARRSGSMSTSAPARRSAGSSSRSAPCPSSSRTTRSSAATRASMRASSSRRRAVIGAGTIITRLDARSTTSPNGQIIKADRAISRS